MRQFPRYFRDMDAVNQLCLGLLLLAVQYAPITAVPNPSSQCQSQCGNVRIPYPFGIGVNCSLAEGFNVNCSVRDGIQKPYIDSLGLEVLSISLSSSTIRVLRDIGTYCYNTSTKKMDIDDYQVVDLSQSPYLLSDVHNKFTVMGCNAVAYMITSDGQRRYLGSCISTCSNMSDLLDLMVDSCSGMGCCQTTIPKGVSKYVAGFDTGLNTSQIWSFARCNYAGPLEAATFNFSTAYISTAKFNGTNVGQVPVVFDWAIRGGTSCNVAKRNGMGTYYACLSSNSVCINSTNGPGHVCNCSRGYEGNPYLPNGCQDVNECNDSPCPLGSICHNTVGGYRCSCRAGRKYSNERNTCNPAISNTDISLIIGLTIGFLALVIIIILSGYLIFQKRKLNKTKQEYFQQHGGLILFERMKSERGLAFSVFTETELIVATNNFDKSRIIGKGGHGTVYKGLVKDNIPVAIKRCALIDERQKKEFGQEMLILSQINHKNVVKLLGCCLEVEVPMLVYEFIPNGTMFELIHGNNKAQQIPFSVLLRVAHEAAEGLHFLHSYACPPIIHGDVKTANILLDDNYTAKVSDFGASILAPSDKEQFVTMVQGTCGYLDPEYMQTCQLTDKSDVYSFGVILLEILTGQVPLKLEGPETQRSLSSVFLCAMKENKLESVLPRHVKGQESTELLRGLAELAKQCLDMCGSNRPSMREVSDELSRLRKLSLHPWVRVDVETETESLLSGPSATGFEIETSTGYPSGEGENLPMNPRSSYYAR